jgi:uncharacterized metal-binding protein
MKSKSEGEKPRARDRSLKIKTPRGVEAKPSKAGSPKPAPACASCDRPLARRICFSEEGVGSRGCPTLAQKSLLKEANREYEQPEVREFARQASIQEAECYANRHERPYVMQPTKTRIVEIIEFARRMGYRRLGLAFCLGLLGLCVGHDSLFFKYGAAPTTVLAVKDRVTGHNPLAAIYLSDSYYRKIKAMKN